LLEDSDGDFDACGLEFGDSSSADLRIGIDCCDDAAGDSGGDEGVGAGAGSAVVTAGFEGDVGGRAFWGEAAFGGLLEGCDLGVVAIGVEMGSLGEDLGLVSVWADEDAAYLGVRGGEGYRLMGEAQGSFHEELVL
jgi:hypothetical protein